MRAPVASDEADHIVSTVSGMVQRDVEEGDDDLSVISDITGMTGFVTRQEPSERDEDDTLQNRPGRFPVSRRAAPSRKRDEERQRQHETFPPVPENSHSSRKPLVSREVHEPHGIPIQPRALKKAIQSSKSEHRRNLNG